MRLSQRQVILIQIQLLHTPVLVSLAAKLLTLRFCWLSVNNFVMKSRKRFGALPPFYNGIDDVRLCGDALRIADIGCL